MPSLLVSEHDRSLGKVKISKSRFIIGRSRSCDCTMDRPGVAKSQCEFFQYNGRMMLRDLAGNSTTLVNGEVLTSPAPVEDGMVLTFAGLTMTYAEDEAAAIPGQTRTSIRAPGQTRRMDLPGGAAPGPGTDLDERKRALRAVKQRLHARLIENQKLKKLDLAEEDEKVREIATSVAQEAITEASNDIPAWVDRKQLLKEVLDEVLGLGPLEDLLEDPSITEIMVNNWDSVFVERNGICEETALQFTDNEQVLHVIRRIVAPIGRRIDESSPMVDARLRDGSRVNAIIPPLALNGPTLTIRKFSKDPYALIDLVRFGALSEEMAQFLKLAVERKRNLLISGGTSTGKTTLLNAVSGFIGPKERIITIEDAAELRLHQRHVITLEARPPSVEGTGAIPIRKLVINSLRMRPDRIVVGECRGGEAFDMLQAMNTGHEGSITTIHANSPRDALSRLENMVLMAELNLPSRAIRQQISSAINLVVHLQRMSDGSRRITHITEITGTEGEVITTQDIFLFEEKEVLRDGKIVGQYSHTGVMPAFLDGLRDRGAEFRCILEKAPKVGQGKK